MVSYPFHTYMSLHWTANTKPFSNKCMDFGAIVAATIVDATLHYPCVKNISSVVPFHALRRKKSNEKNVDSGFHNSCINGKICYHSIQ